MLFIWLIRLIIILLIMLLLTVLLFTILYLVVKAAVKNGIIEAKQVLSKVELSEKPDDGTQVAKTICPNCEKRNDIDYPKLQ